MTQQLNFKINENKSSSQTQPIIISWTNPSADNQTDQVHIKQEAELNIITQIVQQVPLATVESRQKSKARQILPKTQKQLDNNPIVSISEESAPIVGRKKFVKILPKNGNEEVYQRTKQEYLKLPKRKYTKRHIKTPEELIMELSADAELESENDMKLMKVTSKGHFITKEGRVFNRFNEKFVKQEDVEVTTRKIELSQKKLNLPKPSESLIVVRNISSDIFGSSSTENDNFMSSCDTVIKKEVGEESTVKLTKIELNSDLCRIEEEVMDVDVESTRKFPKIAKSGLNDTKVTKSSVVIEKISPTSVKLPIALTGTAENIKVGNVNFIKTTDQTGAIKLITVPSNSQINTIQTVTGSSSSFNFLPSSVKVEVPTVENVKLTSVQLEMEIEETNDDDTDDEHRLIIKEEEEEHIIDVHEDEYQEIPSSSSVFNFNQLIPTPTSNKRPLTFTEEKAPKKLKIHDSATNKHLRRKSSTSSDGTAQPFHCKICFNTFKRKIDLIHHSKSHAEAQHQCQKCSMKFKFVGYFLKHKCIECQICNQTFFLKQLLRNHQRIVHDFKFDLYECDLCGKKVKNRHGIQYHMAKTHMKLVDRYECDICGKKSSLKETMRLHIKNHALLTVECIVCSKKVKQVNYYVHLRLVHAKDRNFKCSYCDQSFKTKDSLKSHIRTHEKNFECTECGKKFANNSHLKEHMEWHRNPDDFKCKICNKIFAQKYCLKSHIKLHGRGLNFERLKCTFCTYTTDNPDNMKKHELKHQRQNENKELKKDWVQCEKCPLKVKNKLKLATHYWKKHNEVIP